MQYILIFGGTPRCRIPAHNFLSPAVAFLVGCHICHVIPKILI
jgi:hypothetical protein